MRFASSFSRSPGSSASSSHRVSSVTVAGTWRGLTAVFLRRVMRLVGWKHCPRCAAALENDGRTATCGECGFTAYAGPEPTVSALVTDDDGRILLARRKFEPEAGKWDLPGGFLEVDEEPLDGLRRELREEAGVEIEPLEFAGAWADRYGGADGRLGHAQPLLARSDCLGRADSRGRCRRVPLVRRRRPSARRRDCLHERREGATLRPMKRLLVVAVVLLALAPGAGARPEVAKVLLGITGDPARFQAADGTEVGDQARLPGLAAGHDVGDEVARVPPAADPDSHDPSRHRRAGRDAARAGSRCSRSRTARATRTWSTSTSRSTSSAASSTCGRWRR